MSQSVWVLTDRDEGVLGVFVHQIDAVMHLQDVAPGSPLVQERSDGSLGDFALRYRLEQMPLR